MTKESAKLNNQFQPATYELFIENDFCSLLITGRKLPPPSKRITFHQNGLKIISTKIIKIDKKGEQIFEIARINHLPSFEQFRIHTQETLFPGNYKVEIKYALKPEKLATLKKLGNKTPDRRLMPSIDEPEAWARTVIKIK